MRVVQTTAIIVSVFASATSVSTSGQARAADDRDASRMVHTYCAGCHNGIMRSPSGALLDRLDTAAIADNRDIWSRAYRQLEAGTMPPFGAPRPDRMGYRKLLSSIETAFGAGTPPPTDATNQEIADRLAALLWNSAP